jgi:hypothetical protein
MNIPAPWTTYLTDNPADESVIQTALGLKVHGAENPTITRFNMPSGKFYYYFKAPTTKSTGVNIAFSFNNAMPVPGIVSLATTAINLDIYDGTQPGQKLKQ